MRLAFPTSKTLSVRDFAFASPYAHGKSALRTTKQQADVSTLPDALAMLS